MGFVLLPSLLTLCRSSSQGFAFVTTPKHSGRIMVRRTQQTKIQELFVLAERSSSIQSSDGDKQDYDAIIIGSGMGSLVAGNVLAGAGRRVVMLESHSIPGGLTTNFYRKGYRFEVSTHMITGCGRGGAVGDLLHDVLHVDDDDIEFIQLKEQMRWIDPSRDIDYVVPLSLSEHIRQLAGLFPSQEEGIKEFYRRYYPIVEFVLNYKQKQGLDQILYSLSNVPVLIRLLMLKGKTASDILDPLVTEPACRDIMTVMTMIFGLDYTELDAPIFLFGCMGHHAAGGEFILFALNPTLELRNLAHKSLCSYLLACFFSCS